MQDLAQDLCNRFSRLQAGRGTFEALWEEIAKTVLPQYAWTFFARGNEITQGMKKTESMVDATAALALPKFAAVMESLLTPRQQIWHLLKPTDKSLKRNRNVMLWFDEVNRLLYDYRYAPKANFQSQNHEGYMQLGAFGTDCMFIDSLDGGVGLRYRSCPLGEMFFLENHQGQIDTVYRRLPLTARQAVQKWGDKVPENIRKLAESGTNQEMQYQFLHCVKPRTEAEGYDPNRADAKGMKYASYYLTYGTGTGSVPNVILQEGGYRTFPYAIGRYVLAPGEVYGRSPAWLVLPNIKVLNEQKRTLLKIGHRAVDPVLLAHDDGIIDSFSLKPGSMNYGGVTADGRPLVHALPTGNVPLMEKLMEPERHSIHDAFLITLFEILVQDRRDMTATEVLERAREKGMFLSPTMGRQQTEMLNPMIERELDVLTQQGLIPPMPQMLLDQQAEYKVEYDSPMSRMARAEQASGFMRVADFGIQYATATQDPSLLDYLDFDAAIPEFADINGVPARLLRSQEAVDAIRKGRNQQAATAQMIEAAPAAASVIKTLSATRQ